MAGASQKKLAVSNTSTLKEIHTLSAAVNSVAIFVLFLFHRPASKLPYALFSTPAYLCQYIIEKTGRPQYQNGTLVNSGADLKQAGLTEYFFDIIYFTLLCDVLMIIFGSNKIPAFALYKLFGLFQMGRQMMGGGKKTTSPKESAQEKQEPTKSKRQTKLEARNKKQQVRYR